MNGTQTSAGSQLRREILLIPDTRKGHGTGHIVRASRTAGELQATLLLDYPWSGTVHDASQVNDLAQRSGVRSRTEWLDHKRHWEAIVVDAQAMSREDVLYLRSIAPVVGVDLGGSGRPYASYLIDTLPNLEAHKPNLLDPGLNALPPFRHRAKVDVPARTLIALGGEDPAGYSVPLLRALDRSGMLPANSVDLALGALSGAAVDIHTLADSDIPAFNQTIRTDALSVTLEQYDLVVCTFGLTCYEALACGATVFTVAPTAYHERLSRAARLPLIGGPTRSTASKAIFGAGTREAKVSVRRVRRALSNYARISSEQARQRPVGTRTLAQAIASLDFSGTGACPLGGGFGEGAQFRSSERTFHASHRKRLLYLERFVPDTITYGEHYFFEQYEAQYGRSYLQDFPHIRSLCEGRLRRIERRSRRLCAESTESRQESQPLLVDLGCAYGPMLAAARERGYRVRGVDYFEGAVDYVREELGIHAIAGDICAEGLPERLEVVESADIVTMWYVIEHLRDLTPLLRNVVRMLRPGGLFAFSTPNASGVSARSNPGEFYSVSPEDHWTLWKANETPALLEEIGFSQAKVHVTGHHPERFDSRLVRYRPGRAVLGLWSELALLGDTFEAYAVKTGGRGP